MSSLKVVRMLSGEDVLCKVQHSDENTVTMDEAVVMVPTQNGQVQFVPYAPFVKDKQPITVKQSLVVYIADPATDFEDHHRKMFSGIVLAGAGAIQ